MLVVWRLLVFLCGLYMDVGGMWGDVFCVGEFFVYEVFGRRYVESGYDCGVVLVVGGGVDVGVVGELCDVG